MPVFGGITPQAVTSGAQSRLMTLRLALEAAQDFHLWLSSYSASDLEAAPLSYAAGDATAILTAFNDASKLYDLYNGGTLGSYTLPYNFSASQRIIIGPQF